MRHHDTAAIPSLPRPPRTFAVMRSVRVSASRSSGSVAPCGPSLGVPPRALPSLPIRHILVRALAALDAVCAERNDVVRAMRARRRVLVFMRPRVFRRRRLLPVRAGPVRETRWRGDERLQALLRRRVTAKLELEQVERL